MTTLLLIDVQKDFHPGGSLAIPSADADAARTASFIAANSSSISRIVATMDSHQKLHIAHPCFWTDAGGNHPDPFTLISSEDVESGRWIPRGDVKHPAIAPYVDPEVLGREGELPPDLFGDDGALDVAKYCVLYTKRLEAKGRFKLCIWPEHCIIGTEGHNVVTVVMDAIQKWSHATGGSVEWAHKGINNLTESYSALASEVPVDEETSFNHDVFESLKKGTDKLVMCGQALSHCVNYTVRDILEHWPKDEVGKLTVLSDCASSVPGFEEAGKAFLSDMQEAGLNVETSETFQC